MAGADDRAWRLGAAALAAALGLVAMLAGDLVGPRLMAVLGIVCFIAIVAACSTNLRAVSWRTVGWGIALQWLFALLILKLEVGGVRPGYELFSHVADFARRFLEFPSAGAQLVFGDLANQEIMSGILPNGFIFAFTALPTIIFISSFFTVLYHVRVLQVAVQLMATAMMYFMRTSGAETLASAANVFMGQTEAPIIVKPFVPEMTESELLALMVGGLATISGAVMGVYIAIGADPVAILTTSLMAAPCGLYLSKIMIPETARPVTSGDARIAVERTHVNVIDAAASGASDGTALAINVAAMLIAFLAFIAFIDYLLGLVSTDLSLARLFAWTFAPVARLMGVPSADVPAMADLLGTKLVANEFVAYIKLTGEYRESVSPRTYVLATYALTGFANFGSIGIILGGIGALAPTRRSDLARLGLRALLAGFLATMINASIASILI